MFVQMPLGAALKAVTDMTSPALCSRGSCGDLLACDLETPQTRESSCLWRKNWPLSFLLCTASPSFLLPWHSRWGAKTRPTLQTGRAQALQEWAHVSFVWTTSQEKNGFHPPHCFVVMEPRPLAVLTAYSTNFRLNHWYNLDYYEHQCP